MKLQLNVMTHFMSRTTIEIEDVHRAMLRAIAISRGWHGFARAVEEIIDLYLDPHAEAEVPRRAHLERWGVGDH